MSHRGDPLDAFVVNTGAERPLPPTAWGELSDGERERFEEGVVSHLVAISFVMEDIIGD